MKELGTFGELVKLKAFVAFASAEEALANINDISEGTLPPSPRTCPRAAARCQPTRLRTALHAAAAVGEGLPPGRRRRQGTTLSDQRRIPGVANETLKNFLVTNLEKPQSTEKCDFRLGVSCPKLGSAIQVSGSPLRATSLLLRQASMPRRVVWERKALLRLSAAVCVAGLISPPSSRPGHDAVPVQDV